MEFASAAPVLARTTATTASTALGSHGSRSGHGGGSRLSALAAALVALAAALLLALCAVQPAHAVDANGYWGSCTWKVVGDTLTVEAGSGGATAGYAREAPWKTADMTGVTKIVVGTQEKPVVLQHTEGVELFSSLGTVVSIDLSHLDVSMVTSMLNMFSSCRSLETLDLSGFDTSKVDNMSSMFSSCESLKNLDLSGFDTSEVKDISRMFYGCKSLETLNLSGFDTSKVTTLGSMFSGCQALKTIDLSSFDTSLVKSMSYLFSNCKSLASLDLSTFKTSKVTTVQEMFYGCDALTSLDLSSFDTSSLTDMGSMFSNCDALTSLDLSSFDTSSVTDMKGLFRKTSLFALRLGEKFNGSFELTDNTGKTIAGTELMATDKWLDPEGGVHGRKELNPSTMGAGWYLAQPTSGSYALFDWRVPATSPVFAPVGAQGTVAPPASLENRTPSNWLNAKGEEVGLGAQAVAPNSATAFSATWEQLPVARDQFDVKLPEGAVYDGRVHKALVKPVNSFVGKVTEVRYTKDDGTTTTAPKDAGTYQVSLVCEQGAGFHASAEPIPCGEFSIGQRVLNNEVNSLVSLQIYQGEKTRPSIEIPLGGGNIVGVDEVRTVADNFVFPSADALGSHNDGIFDVVALKNPNYTLPEGGIKITDQNYRVSPKKEPSLSDFRVTAPNLEYDGNAHAAEVQPSDSVTGMGAVTVSYTRTDGEPSEPTATAPIDAGTYQVTLHVAEGYAYTEATIPASQFTIAKRVLNGNEKASLGTVAVNTTQAADVPVVLTGGAIVAGEQVQTTASKVEYPGAAVAGEYHNAAVTLVTLPSGSNYALPEGGSLVLRDQSYLVSDKPVPTVADFDVSTVEAEYSGQAQPAAITPHDGVGAVENVRYLRAESISAGGPVDAGTYTLMFDVGEGDAYAATKNLTVSGAVKIVPRVLDASVTATLGDIQQDTFEAADVDVTLSGEYIPASAPLAAVASKVTYHSAGAVGKQSDATVVLASIEESPNYVLPKGGLTLENQAYTVIAKTPTYEIAEGENGSWKQGSGKGLRFSADAEFSKFQGVSLNGALVDSKNYTAETGSTIVTLKPAYLATLTPGTYTLRLAFTDGAAETTFTVAAASKPEPDSGKDPGKDPGKDSGKDTGNGSGSSDSKGSTLAATGDSTAPLALATAALAALAGASLVASRRARR